MPGFSARVAFVVNSGTTTDDRKRSRLKSQILNNQLVKEKSNLRASDRVPIHPETIVCVAKAKPHAKFVAAKVDGEVNLFAIKRKMTPEGVKVIRQRMPVSDVNFNLNFDIE